MAAKKSVRRAAGTKKARARSVSKAPAVTQHLLPAGTRAPDFTQEHARSEHLAE